MRKPTDLTDRLALDQRELARAMNVSPRTIRAWMRDEGLPFLRVGGVLRFPVIELRRWMAARTESEERTEALLHELLDS